MKIPCTLQLGIVAVMLFPGGKTLAAPEDTRSGNGEEHLVGRWELRGDCLDSSGNSHHGENHGVRLSTGEFDGSGSYIEVGDGPSIQLGTGDFTIAAWIHTEAELDDAVGDIFDLYDPASRRGITLSIGSSASGYTSQGADRHVYFGIDNGHLDQWKDCGRPNPTSPYISNSMLVHDGHLYAATIDARDENQWAHVYRYKGGLSWADCGRVGTRRTTGVGPLTVHQGSLYAVTTTYDWTRVNSGGYDPGRVYRYAGGKKWIDSGQPSTNRTLNGAISYKGKLYVGGGPEEWGVFAQNENQAWAPSMLFPRSGPRKCFPHAMGRYNGRLFVAFPSAYSFDGHQWTYAGVPAAPESTLQTHSFTIYQGNLCAGTWPRAVVARYLGGEEWQELGRLGVDGTEVNSLRVHNGKLYGGCIPRGEVCRYDGTPQWTSLKQFHSRPGWIPVPPVENGGNPTRPELNEWTRVTSLTTYRGLLFAGIGNCTSSVADSPADVRGRIFSIEAGKCVSYDENLAPGWRHITAIRQGSQLKLYIDGRLVGKSTPFKPADFDLSVERPLRIGFGQTDYFSGKISDLRLYRKALRPADIRRLAAARPG